jgi:hypothetical protein
MLRLSYSMSQVEEAVCVHSVEFLGTLISSVTQDIGYMRLAAGVRRNLFFEELLPKDTGSGPRFCYR